MDTYDIIIIGGGVGGLACGITLASAHAKPWFKDRRVLVIDDGSSDLEKAKLFNVPGVAPGTTGTQALHTMRMQFQQYPPATLHVGCVCSAQRDGDHWTLRPATNAGNSADCPVNHSHTLAAESRPASASRTMACITSIRISMSPDSSAVDPANSQSQLALVRK
jgi:hypothetical protein